MVVVYSFEAQSPGTGGMALGARVLWAAVSFARGLPSGHWVLGLRGPAEHVFSEPP